MALKMVGQALDIGLTARDPEKLVAFYRDFLGFPLAEERHFPANGAHKWFFDVGVGQLWVIGFDKVPAAANPRGGNTSATGIRYMALYVEDVRGAIVGLEAAGGRIQMPPTNFGDSLVVFIEDPEGNCIELLQRAES
ncbi:MAG: VOC family protein [Acidobacteria bacterium]|nr:VOC family protein [Acidobacteriota bacterium]